MTTYSLAITDLKSPVKRTTHIYRGSFFDVMVFMMQYTESDFFYYVIERNGMIMAAQVIDAQEVKKTTFSPKDYVSED